MKNKRQTGAEYEHQAALWLEERGFLIVEQNYRCRSGEIDLVAREGSCLVFVEVKYRRSGRMGHPAEAVDARKQRKIARTAAFYCYERGIPEDQECRFDVVSILDGRTEHIRNAFEMQGQGSIWTGNGRQR